MRLFNSIEHARYWLIFLILMGWSVTSYQCYHYQKLYDEMRVTKQNPSHLVRWFVENYYQFSRENFVDHYVRAMELLSPELKRKAAQDMESIFEKLNQRLVSQDIKIEQIKENVTSNRWEVLARVLLQETEELHDLPLKIILKIVPEGESFGWQITEISSEPRDSTGLVSAIELVPERMLELQIPCVWQNLRVVPEGTLTYFFESTQPQLVKLTSLKSPAVKEGRIEAHCKDGHIWEWPYALSHQDHTHFRSGGGVMSSSNKLEEEKSSSLVRSRMAPLKTPEPVQKNLESEKKRFRELIKQHFRIEEDPKKDHNN